MLPKPFKHVKFSGITPTACHNSTFNDCLVAWPKWHRKEPRPNKNLFDPTLTTRSTNESVLFPVKKDFGPINLVSKVSGYYALYHQSISFLLSTSSLSYSSFVTFLQIALYKLFLVFHLIFKFVLDIFVRQ